MFKETSFHLYSMDTNGEHSIKISKIQSYMNETITYTVPERVEALLQPFNLLVRDSAYELFRRITYVETRIGFENAFLYEPGSYWTRRYINLFVVQFFIEGENIKSLNCSSTFDRVTLYQISLKET